MELNQYAQLVFLLGLGAPALAAATAIVFDMRQRTVELYVAMLSLCVVFLGYQFLRLPAVSVRIFAYSVLGIGLAHALVRWEMRTRGAKRLSSPSSRYVFVLIAGVEELFYRGLLLDMALSVVGRPAQTLAIVALIFWFAAIHVETSFVWKLPLSVALAAIAIASGSIIPAIAAHVSYNLLVVRNDR